MSARMEKVREAMFRFVSVTSCRDAALAEVEEWEARTRVPITPERLRELQEAEVRAEAAEAKLATVTKALDEAISWIEEEEPYEEPHDWVRQNLIRDLKTAKGDPA